ncbi:MAG: DUF1634 domain-containing protein [Peptococcaceae bacterium]|jgi:uncharacterized membrane protein|nr:DUF1634 domain-containing protein [Peptococcaceae bacterium]
MALELESRAVALDQTAFGAGYAHGSKGYAETKPQEVSKEEAFVGNLLKYGVFFSVAISALGSLLYFVQHGLGGSLGAIIQYSANPAFPHSVGALAAGIGRFSSSAVIAVGLLLLVALRVFQVLLSGVVFAFKRNFKFTFISVFVFGILMSSLFLGRAGG